MMNKKYNNFCWYECTGGCAAEIRGCKDRNCPFYNFRRGGLEPEIYKDIKEKMESGCNNGK